MVVLELRYAYLSVIYYVLMLIDITTMSPTCFLDYIDIDNYVVNGGFRAKVCLPLHDILCPNVNRYKHYESDMLSL